MHNKGSSRAKKTEKLTKHALVQAPSVKLRSYMHSLLCHAETNEQVFTIQEQEFTR